MAEGFELYHVPQQSRREKLRVSSHHPPPPPDCAADSFQASAALLPLYDPTLIPSDFVTCAATVHRHAYGLDPGAGVKEEGANLMAFLGGAGGAGHVFADPGMPAQLNPSSIQDINGGPYAYPSPAHCFQSYQPRQEPNGTGQSLSLSLSSNHSTIPNLPLELNLQKYNFGPCKASFGPIESSKSTVPLGPFTGYASVLKGSRFLRPAQQLLEELCYMSRGMYSDKNGADPGLLDPPSLDNLSGDGIIDDSGDGAEQTGKKSRLLSMLDEVYKRYRQYYQQMQAAVSAFESVAGLSSAAPFANLALKAMSKHFRCLKNAITDQLQFASKPNLKANSNRDETQRLESLGKGLYVQRPLQGAGFVDPPVWRPQRGLPEHAVTVLRSWLFEHFLHPYPTDTDKLMLAKQTGLSRNQVSNWFINARVRLWKPMVEEIHTLETRQQGQNSSQMTDQSPNSSCHLSTSHPTERKNSYPDNFPSKRTREGPTSTPRANSLDPIKSPYHNLLSNNNNNSNNNNQFHAGMSSAGGNSGVSLTLGLHQNELGLPDSYPINAARRFGLDLQPGEYVGHSRQFGREMVDGQQIMHDFVG